MYVMETYVGLDRTYNIITISMFIKEAVASVGRRLFPEKELAHLENNIIVQFLFFTTLKNYIYEWIAKQKVFSIPSEIKTKASRSKIILVLDMDETLVYTRRASVPDHSNYIKADFQGSNMYVEPRPYAKQFLESVAEIFTVYVYTAGKKKYADAVLNIIDPKKIIQKRFYRETCKKVNGTLIKDLKYLKKMLKSKQEMVLVDDNHMSFENNYPFAIKIQPFEGNQMDQELLHIFEKVLKFYI